MPFSRSAHLYDLIYSRARDYRSQARSIIEIVKGGNRNARSLLDVACGTGLHLAHLAEVFEVAGVDICQPMVDLARARNPDVPVERGDMRTFRLGRRFDAVTCLYSSITYARTLEELHETLRTFAAHLNPGGVCVVEPYLPPGNWVDGLLGLRTAAEAARSVAMVDRAERRGREVRREIGYAVTTPQALELFQEVHEFTLFTRDEYGQAFRSAGLEVGFRLPGFDPARGLFVATRPTAESGAR